MNGSKPYAPSRDERTSGEMPIRFLKRASRFPQPSPSGEGESPLPFSTTEHGVGPT